MPHSEHEPAFCAPSEVRSFHGLVVFGMNLKLNSALLILNSCLIWMALLLIPQRR
jgi:hypothetical protein